MNVLRKAAITLSLLLASSPVVLAQPVPTFNDVPEDYWAFSFIEQFAALGITSGCGGGDYCPEATVTSVEIISSVDGSFFGPVFSQATVGLADPNVDIVDNANFNYTMWVQMEDLTVVDPFTDSVAFRGCSIEMSR